MAERGEMSSAVLPEGTKVWREFAVKVEVSEAGGYCLQVYRRDRNEERWINTQVGAATLQEFGVQLAALLDEVHRRGIATGKEQIRVALGFPGGEPRK